MKSLLFALADRPFALPVEAVAEVARPINLAAASGPPWLAGTLRERGKALWVVNLLAFLGLNRPAGRDDHIVIVRKPGGFRCGLLVQRVQGVEQVTVTDICVPAALAAAPAGAYIRGITPHGGRPLYLLALDRILDAGELRDLGEPPTSGSPAP